MCYYGFMDTIEVIKHMLMHTNTSKRSLSLRIGKSQNYLVNSLASNKDMSAMNLARIAQEMGYTLQITGHGEVLTIDPLSDQENNSA